MLGAGGNVFFGFGGTGSGLVTSIKDAVAGVDARVFIDVAASGAGAACATAGVPGVATGADLLVFPRFLKIDS